MQKTIDPRRVKNCINPECGKRLKHQVGAPGKTACNPKCRRRARTLGIEAPGKGICRYCEDSITERGPQARACILCVRKINRDGMRRRRARLKRERGTCREHQKPSSKEEKARHGALRYLRKKLGVSNSRKRWLTVLDCVERLEHDDDGAFITLAAFVRVTGREGQSPSTIDKAWCRFKDFLKGYAIYKASARARVYVLERAARKKALYWLPRLEGVK